MRILVESLTRLYGAKKLTYEQIKERVSRGSITEDEFKSITGEDYTA